MLLMKFFLLSVSKGDNVRDRKYQFKTNGEKIAAVLRNTPARKLSISDHNNDTFQSPLDAFILLKKGQFCSTPKDLRPSVAICNNAKTSASITIKKIGVVSPGILIYRFDLFYVLVDWLDLF